MPHDDATLLPAAVIQAQLEAYNQRDLATFVRYNASERRIEDGLIRQFVYPPLTDARIRSAGVELHSAALTTSSVRNHSLDIASFRHLLCLHVRHAREDSAPPGSVSGSP
jgi:hypothetical protein